MIKRKRTMWRFQLKKKKGGWLHQKNEDESNIAATGQDASENTFRPEISISRTTV